MNTEQTPAERLLDAATLSYEQIEAELNVLGIHTVPWTAILILTQIARDKTLAAAFEVFEPVEQKAQVLLDALTPFTLEAYAEEVQLLHNALTAHAALKAGLEKG